ncbi:MAG: hypothetical protein LBQ94_07920 [Treponema sp.]|jgi:hypothetical protein|nr:hypothetical protein [Treponema sp.]
MKSIVRMALFFSLTFLAFFVAAVLLTYVSSLIELARVIPAGARVEEAAKAFWIALPAALYLSILITLSYSARKKMPIKVAILSIVVFACIFTVGFSLGIDRVGALEPIFKPVAAVEAEPGLILSQSGTRVVLLKESSEVLGPRLVSIPGEQFIYQEQPIGPYNTVLPLPALSFGNETPWFVRSIAIDLSLSARELKNRLEDNYLHFAAYAFSLILLLSSLRFLVELSKWPLANMFLGALVFRGVLALETFLNTGEINTLIGSFLGGRIPSTFVTPCAFAALAILIILYTLLTRLARHERSEEDG